MRGVLASAAVVFMVVATPAVGQTNNQTRQSSLQAKKATPSVAKKATAPKKSTAAKKSAAVKKPTQSPSPPVQSQAKGTYLGGCDAALLNASACQGYYEGNILNGSATDIPIQQAAVAALPSDITFNGDWNSLGAVTTLSGPNNNQINFGVPLLGETVIGIHFGNVAGDAGNVTAFYYFNFAQATNFITLNDTQGFSNAVLYATNTGAVPEPGTWAMMLLGFAGIGGAVRRARKQNRLLQIA